MRFLAWPGRSVRKPCPQLPASVSPLSGVFAKLLGGTSCWAEPSALKPETADGSILQARTLHALGLNHGQFDVNRTNHPRGDSISRTVHVSEAHLPCYCSISRTVPFPRPEPSTKTPHIMEGSASRAEPSTLKPETVEGSILQDRTIHENAPHHGRFSIQSGTIRAEARNRGRFHFPRPNPPRKRPASWKVQCPERNHPR